MKTNQVMVRPMGPFKVEQRTKDAYFNATSLLKQWNDTTGSKKELKDYLSNKSTKELATTIINRENLNRDNSPYLSTRGKNGGSWMHPILFMDFAMWINSSFKYDVIKFVYDQMIEYRKKSGDAYRELAAAVALITPKNQMQDVMKKIGRSINIIVKGKHEKNLRNQYGDEQSQFDYMALEKKLAMLINEGFIRTLADLGNYLRKLMGDKLPKIQ
jgi:hypothetical protein